MKDIKPQDRLIANVITSAFTPWKNVDGTDSGTAVLQLGDHTKLGIGFHIYSMTPGSSSEAQRCRCRPRHWQHERRAFDAQPRVALAVQA